MATDPVSAFMMGFRAVDQYETNKQLRQFREEEMQWAREDRGFLKEQQSHLRKVYKQQEQAWAQAELERFQEENMTLLEATAAQLHEDLGKQSEELAYAPAIKAGRSEEEARDAQGKWLQSWYGKDGRQKFFGEVVRRMSLSNPKILEHIALAVGRDPAAGPLVDGANPVANMILHPDGDGRFTFEYRRKSPGRDGEMTGPATVGRSDSGSDKIDWMELSTPAMVKVFGPAFMTSPAFMTQYLRDMLGKKEGANTGDSRAEPPPARSRETAPATEPATPPVTPPANRTAKTEPSLTLATGGAAAPPTNKPDDLVQIGEMDGNPVMGKRPPSPDDVTFATGGAAPPNWDPLRDATRPGIEREQIGTLEGQPVMAPTTPAQAKEAPGGDTLTVASASSGEVSDQIPAPANQEQTQAAADTVVKASESKRRIPFRHELYNAAMLVKGGYITEEEFRTFAKTGKLEKEAEYRLFQTSQGLFTARTDESGNIQIGSQIRFASEQGLTDKERHEREMARLEYLNTVLRTIENKEHRQQVANDLNAATRLLGEDVLNSDGMYADHLIKAANLYSKVDPSLIQGVGDAVIQWAQGGSVEGFEFDDINPFSEPTTYRGGLGMAMTDIFVRAETVASERDLSVAFKQYGNYLPAVLGGLGGVSEQVAIKLIENIEGEVSKNRKVGSVIQITDHNEVVIGEVPVKSWMDSPAEIRGEMMKKLIEIFGTH